MELYHLLLPYLPGIGVCTVLAVWLLWRRSCRPSGGEEGMPPGPQALPVIGHLHLLGLNPHQSFYHMSKTHGPLMSLKLGSVPVVVASTPGVAMQILQTHDKILSGRPPNLTIPKNCFGCPDIAFSSPGPYWRLMRQICVTEFFSNKRLEYFKSIRTEELGVMIRSILEVAGTPIPVLKNVQNNNNNVIARMALGERMLDPASPAHQQTDTVVSIIVEMISILGAFNVGDFIPSLSWTDLQGYIKQSKNIGRRSNAVFQKVIDARRNSRKEGDPPKDFLDLLLLAAVDSKNKEMQLEDGHIRAILMDMMSAGTDTSATTTEWALSELLANPEKLKKIQQELDEVVGRSRILEESDLPNLPYLHAVINEAMRLHPAAPMLAPHYALEACEIDGYRIPANTVIYVNVWAIGRDPVAWPNPLEFRPERFVGSNIDPLGQHFALIPFGSGRRICPGWRLGLLNVEYILASLLHAFDWTVASKPDMDEKFSIIMSRKNKLITTPTPRLPKSLYDTYM